MKNVEFNDFYFGTVKWNQMFESEAELIEHVKTIDIVKFKKNQNGFEFIEGFQKALASGRELSKPQITQLKRLAKQVYMYHNNM